MGRPVRKRLANKGKPKWLIATSRLLIKLVVRSNVGGLLDRTPKEAAIEANHIIILILYRFIVNQTMLPNWQTKKNRSAKIRAAVKGTV
jgi:hypothetical protein